MGLWDSISNAASSVWSGIGGWSGLGNIANIAGTAYDIYSGIQANNLADKYASLAFGSAEKQDAYAQEAWNRQKNVYWPLEDLNVQYTMEDMKALRPAYQNQINYQAQRMNEQLAQAKQLNPIIDDTELSLVRKLVEGEDVIAERLMNQATADISTAYGAQRESDMRSMGIAGVNPNSGQMQNYMNRMGTSQALAESTARTQASRQAEELAISRQSTALNYAKGAMLPEYSYTPSVNSGSILGGLSGSGGAYTGLSQMYNQNAQNSFNGAYYQLNQLSNGQINPGYQR